MRYIAADFGAGSGRIMVGNIQDDHLELEEVHRFANHQIKLGKNLHWNFLSLFHELKKGIQIATQKYSDIKSIGIDTWGVDFGLLDVNGNLTGNPFCYRDSRTNGMLSKAFKLVSKDDIYKECGTQFMEINTAFQLLAMKLNNEPQLKIAKHLLFMPDLFNYYLTGIKKNEYTIASTSNLLDAKTRTWSKKIITRLGLPQNIFCDIVYSANVIGKFKKSVCEELNCYSMDVIATGSHDTANAAFTAYTKKNSTAFLSSGTWSLLGVHLQNPILAKPAMQADFTNEGGINNNILFLKNIPGFWILQSLVKEWQQQENIVIDYDKLVMGASAKKTINTILDTEDKNFISPISMQKAINDYCQRTNQKVPENKSGYVRTIIESLAVKYKATIQQMEKITGNEIEQIHIVGGGSQNQLLNQLTANATKKQVIAGPTEATVIGNIIVQAMAKKQIKSLHKAASIIQNSFALKQYHPQ